MEPLELVDVVLTDCVTGLFSHRCEAPRWGLVHRLRILDDLVTYQSVLVTEELTLDASSLHFCCVVA